MISIRLDNVDKKYPWVLTRTSGWKNSNSGFSFKTEEKFMGLEGLLRYAFNLHLGEFEQGLKHVRLEKIRRHNARVLNGKGGS